jgi:methylthioribose-1-phosphate isomerase
VRTIDWLDGSVRIIDQTRLPHAEVGIDVRDVEDLVVHIRSLAVRGAMALGVAGAMGMALAARHAGVRGGVSIMMSTGRSTHLEAALDIGIRHLRASGQELALS